MVSCTYLNFNPSGISYEGKICDACNVAANPNNPGNPQTPGNPGNPQTPGNPGNPQTPGNPGNPQTPGNPGNPQTPGNPGNPGNPQTPGNPGNPQTPGNPGNPQRRRSGGRTKEIVTYDIPGYTGWAPPRGWKPSPGHWSIDHSKRNFQDTIRLLNNPYAPPKLSPTFGSGPGNFINTKNGQVMAIGQDYFDEDCIECGVKTIMKCIKHILEPMKKLMCILKEVETTSKAVCKKCLCNLVCSFLKGKE